MTHLGGALIGQHFYSQSEPKYIDQSELPPDESQILFCKQQLQIFSKIFGVILFGNLCIT